MRIARIRKHYQMKYKDEPLVKIRRKTESINCPSTRTHYEDLYMFRLYFPNECIWNAEWNNTHTNYSPTMIAQCNSENLMFSLKMNCFTTSKYIPLKLRGLIVQQCQVGD